MSMSWLKKKNGEIKKTKSLTGLLILLLFSKNLSENNFIKMIMLIHKNS